MEIISTTIWYCKEFAVSGKRSFIPGWFSSMQISLPLVTHNLGCLTEVHRLLTH